MESTRVRFGAFEFDARTGELSPQAADGPAPARLPPQPARLLAMLADARGGVVSREAIRARLWPDVEVEFDSSLHFCIRQIRTALGDIASAPRYIETLPRRGYRLIPEVESVEPRTAADDGDAPFVRPWVRPSAVVVLVVLVAAAALVAYRAVQLPAGTGPGSPAVGVMPFVAPPDWGGDRGELAVVGVGVLETLTLAQDGRLRIVGPSSTTPYLRSASPLSDLAEAYELDFIVNGRFVQDSDGPRMLAELIRCSDGAHIWVERYTAFDDGDAIAGEIAREVLFRLP